MLVDYGPAIEPFLRDLWRWSPVLRPLRNDIPDTRKNCWEFVNCESGKKRMRFRKVPVCPVRNEKRLNGIHGGKNAGRACWVVAGTLCNGQVQGAFEEKCENCFACNFYRYVMNQERDLLVDAHALAKLLCQ